MPIACPASRVIMDQTWVDAAGSPAPENSGRQSLEKSDPAALSLGFKLLLDMISFCDIIET